ncbi:MAG: efflux RND transporter permease subunit [Roseicyclus sp.]
MTALIAAAFGRARVMLLLLAGLLATGAIAYTAIPKESTPEVPLPIFFVSTGLDGISPTDAETLLIEPMEAAFGTLTGLEAMESTATEGVASVQLTFTAGGEVAEALARVREAADRVAPELPADAYALTVTEVNTALFPILTVILSGPTPERTLNRLAEEAREAIEALPGVLEVDLAGAREEFVEVLIDPNVFQTYDLSFDAVIGEILRNNSLIAAGALETGGGRIVLKVPGLIEDIDDVLDMPIRAGAETVLTFRDVATIRRSFEDPAGFARIDGQPALTLEVKKRAGANIIETVEEVRAEMAQVSADWPDTVDIRFLQDQSEQVKTLLSDLEANVLAAVILVMVVIVAALGLRAALLVGLAIPGAFLAGVATLWFTGYTMNIVVLFSLILVVGMLVDGAIVTVELADRRLQEGATPREAFAEAAGRMAWPIIASTATTLCVFLPLLFWSGPIGEFMKFMPITVMLTLTASLVMALFFIPVLGGLIGRRQPQSAKAKAMLHAAEHGDPRDLGGIMGLYVRALDWSILRPGAVLLLASALLLGAFTAYGQFGRGVSFFPEVEPEFMQVEIRTRDDFSIHDRDRIVRAVERRLLGFDEIASVYARALLDAGGAGEDVIGTLQLELTDWDRRRSAALIGADIRSAMADLPGIDIEVKTASGGPTGGKPVSLRIKADDPAAQDAAVETIRAAMAGIGGFTNVTDTRPLPRVELSILVDREEAARYGADISLLGQAIQLLTQGILVADYRPDDADGALDIRVRFPRDDRTLTELGYLRVPTAAGLVPISNFVTFAPTERIGTIRRLDGARVVTLEADVAPGLLVNDQVMALAARLAQVDLPEGVALSFGGEAEEQVEAGLFLAAAFGAALVLMVVILLLQFNSFTQAAMVMTSIVFSVAGVLLGLLVTGRPFGIVMGGIGVIALAGIVVNNNIVLIDTYNQLRKAGQGVHEAALRTGAQRVRPVLLTSVTTGLGLMPMVLGVNLNLATREIAVGAPSSQYWTELSTAIAGGLGVATVLTLLVTPAMLVLSERRTARAELAPRRIPGPTDAPAEA